TLCIALCWLCGFGRKTAYIRRVIVTLPLWALMQGYSPAGAWGTVTLRVAKRYILFLLSFLLISLHNGTTPRWLYLYISRKWLWWRHISDLSNINLPSQEPINIPWGERIPIIFAVIGVLALLIGTSVISGHIGPLQIGSATRTSATVVSSISRTPVA